MKAPYIYRMKVAFATKISQSQLCEARENTISAFPGYRKLLNRIKSDSDGISIRVCMPLSDGKGLMSILLSLAAEYIRLQYGSEIKPSQWVIDPGSAPSPDDDNFMYFTGRIMPEFGLARRKTASRDNIGFISLPEGMEPFIKSIACG